MKKNTPADKRQSVLFTCAGRRVSLVQAFRDAAADLNLDYYFVGTDAIWLSPALQICDEKFVVKPVEHSEYINELLNIVKAHNVRLMVPTIDTELEVLAENKDLFAQYGCKVLISEPAVVQKCQDKLETHEFLVTNQFDCPRTLTMDQAFAGNDLEFPRFLKPRNGSASQGNAVAEDREDLEYLARKLPGSIVQEFVHGTEYTCDVYVDFNMKTRFAVPRKRIEVRAGEVSKSQIVKNKEIIDQAISLVQKLGAGPGVITLQLFLCNNKKIKFIEINPRFGGGVPLSIKAGADFPRWLLQELNGQKPLINTECFKSDYIMLRYDAEVWLENYQPPGAQ